MSDMVKCVSKRPKEVFFFFRIDLGAMLVGQFHIFSHSKLYSFFGFVFFKAVLFDVGRKDRHLGHRINFYPRKKFSNFIVF